MAEGRFETGLTRDHDSEARVTGVVVAESCFKTSLTRDPATDVPVAGVVVSGLNKIIGKGPIRHQPDTQGGSRAPCGQGCRGRGPF